MVLLAGCGGDDAFGGGFVVFDALVGPPADAV